MRIPRHVPSLLATAMLLAACGDTGTSPAPSTEHAPSTTAVFLTGAPCGDATLAALLDGPGGAEVGDVEVTNDGVDLLVTVSAHGSLGLRATHVSVSPTLDGIPTNRSGNPIPGHFPLSGDHDPAIAEVAYSVSLEELGSEPGDEVVVAVHADLSDGSGAWAGDTRINEGRRGSWATYFTVEIQACGGILEGDVVDALSATAVGGALVAFGETSTVTGPDGAFSLGLPAGTHTGTVSADGYISASLSVTITTGATTNVVAALSPVLADEEVRIVLTWGADPPDLDSHLTGPIDGSTSRFHVFWAAPGSLTFSPFAALDIDDVTSFGPETITIAQEFDGTYRYSVHDWTNRFASSSTGLAESGAVVKVYVGAAEVASFVPPSEGGTVWTVFELDGSTGSITPVGTMSYQSNSTLIARVGVGEGLADLLVASEGEVGPTK